MGDSPLHDVQAVIMAGGEGTRLRPLTVRQPKPMVPVGSRPVMAYLLQQLRGFGVRQAFATLYYLADEVEGYFGDGSEFGLDLRYSVEDTPLGTAGSVSVLANQFTGTVLVVSGDALTDIDLAAAVRFHRERGAMATLVLTRVPAPLEFGVVIVDPEGRVVRFLEKPSWGEVFSDTVNTGIYVLEPEVWEVQLDRPTDFSRDLFPALLERGAPLYGYIAEGYWTDIGGLDQYQQANFDLLDGRVKVTPPGRLTGDRVWVGEGTQIHPTAVIEGPALIGRNGAIGPGVRIGPFTAIGDHAVVEANADLERSIVWNNVYLGRGARLSGATVCHNVVVKANVHIGEGAVIGDRCFLEEGTTIQPHIKLWPNKITEPGSKVTMSLIWGTKWPGSLFGASGVAGLANVEITPEFATRLGAAFGAYLDRGAQVITSRDTHHVSRMTKRAIIAGLMSVGANILDLRAMPAPVTRHMALVSGAAGGLHVSLSPSDPALTLIEFFDGEGKNLNRQAERKIENIFFREDFRRSHRDDVGSLEFLSRTVEYYTEDFLNFVRADVIRAAGPKLVVDYAHGALCLFMPVVLGRLGCESVALNAYVDPTREALTWEEHRRRSEQIGDVVTALGADLGVVLASHGERMAVTDETGHALSGDELLACYARLLQESRGSQARIAVSVSASSALDALCDGVMRTKADPRSLMEVAAREPELDFVGDDEGGFVFPQFQPAFDAMVSLGKLLELLAGTGRSLSAVRAELPAIHKLHQTVACPWEMKGQIMRQLHEETRDRRVDHTDGIKIFDGGWVLVLPDISGPLFHVYGEADSDAQARALVDQYCQRITALQEA